LERSKFFLETKKGGMRSLKKKREKVAPTFLAFQLSKLKGVKSQF
jgi:hypothetical protein